MARVIKSGSMDQTRAGTDPDQPPGGPQSSRTAGHPEVEKGGGLVGRRGVGFYCGPRAGGGWQIWAWAATGNGGW